jgi:subtilisin family serine protease
MNIGLAQPASGGYAPDSVLVKYRPSASASAKANARALVQADSYEGYGIVRALENLHLKPGQSVARAIDTLENLPFVEYAEPDYLVHKVTTNDTYYGLLYAIENTGQSIGPNNGTSGTPDADMDVAEACAIQTGDSDLIIAVIDEGVQYDHPDLNDNMWINAGEVAGNGVDDDNNGFVDDVYGYDFFSNDGDPMDEGGHGTHVAGTICAETNNGEGISGVVQQCQIMALRFLGPNGGYTSDAIASLDYAVQMGATISNNSWGGGGFSQGLYDAIAAARNADHIFLAAAGNDGTNNDSTPHYPSNYDLSNVVSVAATDNRDQLANFSNYGAQSVDIGAPGVDIASTYINNGYVWMSGTSMATPNVTGVVALIRSQYPNWTYQQVIDHLYATARPGASVTGITTTGAIANAEAAVAGGAPLTAPVAPAGLTASALSESDVELSWTDSSDNESVFVIERAVVSDGVRGGAEELPETVSANTTSFVDSGLAAATEYSYQVKARNSAGESELSNQANATTYTPPPYQEVLASGETTLAGTVVSGSYTSTFSLDGLKEEIRERESSGNPNRRHSYMEHRWSLSAPAGAATLSVFGHSSTSTDGDQFQLAYSTGGGFTTFCTLVVGASPSHCSTAFDIASASTLTVRVTDTDQTALNRDLDSVFIDQIVLQVESGVCSLSKTEAPKLTGNNSSPGMIVLDWSTVTDASRYEVQRSENAGSSWSSLATLGGDANRYEDTTVASATAYDYKVIASNCADQPTSSDVLRITSVEVAAPAITLTASGNKSKGWQNVDLSWDVGVGPVDVYRDGVNLPGGSTGENTYTDEKIAKGAAIYEYQVCPVGTSPGNGSCSNVETVVF